MPPSRRPKKPPRQPAKNRTKDPLTRVAEALERAYPAHDGADSATPADGFVWHPETASLTGVPKISRIPISLLRGIDRQADVLLANTRRHADGLPANNALLWGARGTGKSSLVKAAHEAVNDGRSSSRRLALVEIHREDVETLPRLLVILRDSPRRFILFCDDLTFEGQDASYKALKSVLEGGIEGRPDNVILYATSNRRHMMAREMIENERAAAIHDTEAIEEKVSLSDRFG
ncbi:MAG: ATP-binding protein, partial [Rhodobacteraceae bacterium]|nr:ATP-binding protein [Paracoccaceae bacterium]